MKTSNRIVMNALIAMNAKKVDVSKIQALLPAGCKVIAPKYYANTYRGPSISFFVKVPKGKEVEMYRKLESNNVIDVDPNGDGIGEDKIECLITKDIFSYIM